MDDLWDRIRAADSSWEPEAFISDPLLNDPAALAAAVANPIAAAASASPLAAAFIDIVTAAARTGIEATIDLDSIVLAAAARPVARACIQRFRLTLAGDPGAVAAAYATRPRGLSWQICRWDRARPAPVPPILTGAEYMYLPGGDLIVLLASGSSELNPDANPAAAVAATKAWLFDVLGEFTYSKIQRWTILPRALATVSCDYALRPIATVAANLARHLGITQCRICQVQDCNCDLVGDLCESCATIAARVAV